MTEFDTPKTRAAAILRDLTDGCPAITITDARSHPLLMRNGKRADLPVIYRLVNVGAKSASGRRIYLETARQRHGQVTTDRAIQRFTERLNDIEHCPTSRADADRAEKLIDARLAAAGL